MSDDTTTWLKKNPSINPLRRSLKTSLRFHVPVSDMNTSIMSNPDKVKDQGLFIPRMMQKSNMQMRKSRAHEFKIPELVMAKPVTKKEPSGSGIKHKRIPTPNKASRKSFLPVPKNKSQISDKGLLKTCLPRPNFAPGVSGRRTTAKRDLLKKVMELSEIKRREEAESQVKAVSGDSSVLRSILKRRASLRRSAQMSSKVKPKAKKVLFDGFDNSDGEKENVGNPSVEGQNDFNKALDEPTVFLNFPNGVNVDDSPFEPVKPLNWTIEETKVIQEFDMNRIIKLWESYKDNLKTIQTERSFIERSFESLLQHSLEFQKQYQTYKETSEEMYRGLSVLGKEFEENLKKAMADVSLNTSDIVKTEQKSYKRGSERKEKIKMSDKSKMIKKNSKRKSVPLLKKELPSETEDSFTLISQNSFLEK